MTVDLASCLAQVQASKSWFARRVLPLSIEQVRWRPDARCWSVAECLDHLNLTLDLYLPKIEDAIVHGQGRARLDRCRVCSEAEIEALKAFEPPVVHAGQAAPATMPRAFVDPDCLVEAFHRTRDRYMDTVRRAGELDLKGIRIIDPIYPVVVSLGGTLALIAAHDRRHMWQAERVMQSRRFRRGAL